MRINERNSPVGPRIDGTGGVRDDGTAGQGQAVAGEDRVNVSTTARTLAVLRAQLAPLDTVREGTVAHLRDQVESGQYQPDLHVVARNLIREVAATLAA